MQAHSNLLSQRVVFQPAAVGMTPADVEFGPMTANLLPVKRKNSKDGVVTVFDLASGTTLLQIPGEPMDARRGTLTPDGYTFGWIKSKSWSGSAFKTASSSTKNKSVAFNVGPDATCNCFLPGQSSRAPPSNVIFITDPYKRAIYTWSLSDITKSPPNKLFEFSSPFPEGSQAKPVGKIQHTSDGSWLAFTEWMQWPAIRTYAPNFWAGMVRIYERSSNDYRDVWAQAATFADAALHGSMRRLFIYAERSRPGEETTLHITELAMNGPFRDLQIDVPIQDPFEVPRHVHVNESSGLILLITNHGNMALFSLASGRQVSSDKIANYPRGDDVDFSSSSDGTALFIRTGPAVTAVLFE